MSKRIISAVIALLAVICFSTVIAFADGKPVTPNYIQDDSDYYANSNTANVSTYTSSLSVASKDVTESDITVTTESEETVSTAEPQKEDSKFQKLAKKVIFILLGVIALCILVLVGFNLKYKAKYEKIDPVAKKKAAAKERAQKRNKENHQGGHRPRD